MRVRLTAGRRVEAAASDPAPAVAAQVAQVAAELQEHTVGYGETAYDAETGTVFWVHGDWTSCSVGGRFLDIDGVTDVVCAAEDLPDGWWSGQVVYPENPPKWVTVPPEAQQAALDAAVALAAEPFTLEA